MKLTLNINFHGKSRNTTHMSDNPLALSRPQVNSIAMIYSHNKQLLMGEFEGEERRSLTSEWKIDDEKRWRREREKKREIKINNGSANAAGCCKIDFLLQPAIIAT